MKPPALYLDIEGISLSRYGSVSIIQIFHLPSKHVYLIDVFTLKETAFDVANEAGVTLRSILESPSVTKVFFDVRNDSDALYAHYNVLMKGVQDVQLLEVATRRYAKDRVFALGHCIEKDAKLPADVLEIWKATKARGKDLFAVERGGSAELFNSRPLHPDLISYCSQDVMCLPILWIIYTEKMWNSWQKRVDEETERRVLLALDKTYDPKGANKALSPWKGTQRNRRKTSPHITGQHGTEFLGSRVVQDQRQQRQLTPGEVVAQSSIALVTEKQRCQQSRRRRGSQVPGSKSEQYVKPTESSIFELQFSQLCFQDTDLPIRESDVVQYKAHPDSKTEKAIFRNRPTWYCSICHRDMSSKDQPAHVNGKAHIARAKQDPRAAFPLMSQSNAIRSKSACARSTVTTRKQKADLPKPGVALKKSARSNSPRKSATPTTN